MIALSLRRPDDLDAQLGEESRIAGKRRSETARLAKIGRASCRERV